LSADASWTLLQHFIAFEEDPDSGARCTTIIAGYHQFHAVNGAVEKRCEASGMSASGLDA
jgi:type I restriction enzyme R subunit